MAAPKDVNTDAALASVISKQGSKHISSKEENSTALKAFLHIKDVFTLFGTSLITLIHLQHMTEGYTGNPMLFT